MGFIKYELLIYYVLFAGLYSAASGYPVTNSDTSLNKDEKRYPNGTVVGKYSYTDEEGNPIHVKYYADDASYGVELKSVKVVNSNSNPLQPEKEPRNKYLLPSTGDPFDSALKSITTFKDLRVFDKSPIGLLKDKAKEKLKDDDKNNVEFEIFTQNEVKAPEKCGKEKVKVYFDKDKRKTRNIPKYYESMNYCNKF